MSKPAYFRDVARAHAALSTLHPMLLSVEKPVPLKIGLDADLIAAYPTLSRTLCRRMLRWLTTRTAYLEICREGAQRLGLEGPAGEVSARDAIYARSLVLGRRAKLGRAA